MMVTQADNVMATSSASVIPVIRMMFPYLMTGLLPAVMRCTRSSNSFQLTLRL